MSGGPPVRRIDRAALERIIKRAAELQTGSRETGEHLTPEEVLKLGREVGIDEGYLQQAMLEETTRLPEDDPTGLWNRTVGPASVSAQRVVQGDVEGIEGQLLHWMDENELLTLQRQQSGRLSWEPLSGFQAMMRRSTAALGGGKRPYMLARANTVHATIVPLEPGYCNVVLTAELQKVRAGYLGGIGTVLGVTVAGAAAITVMSPFLLVALLPLPFGAGLAYIIGRQYRPVVERTRLGLERVLDQLERGSVKPSHQLPAGGGRLLSGLAEEIRKALNPRS